MVVDKFVLQSSLFTFGSNAYKIWENLLIFANVGMIIILLVIVFSQVTGHGIDNYGIKKMLPKLIVAAIAINLSFLLCQIAVDVSNIIGKGLIEIFKSVGIKTDISGSRIFGELFGALFLAGSGTGMIAGTIASSAMMFGGGLFFIIPFIFLALYALVSIIIFFLMLGLRQLLAVILVTVAPLAILCYILPNTQQIFKKWLEMFKTILMVYPVCAALWVISKMMYALAMNSESILLVMVGVVMIFLPLAAAPKILEKALAAFGEVGGMLQRMGNGIKGGIKTAEGMVQNSAVMQNAMKRAEGARAQKNIDANEAIRSGKATRGQRLRAALSGGERGYMRSISIADKQKQEDNAARAMIAGREHAGKTQPEIEALFTQAVMDGNTEQIDALNTVGVTRFGSGWAKTVGNALSKMNMVDENGKVNEKAKTAISALQNNMNHNANFSNMMKQKDSAAFSMIQNAGMQYNKDTGKAEYANLSEFDANNGVATDINDWSTHGAGALQRAIDKGALKPDMIDKLLTSTDPAIQSGIQSDSAKLDVLQGNLYNMQNGTNLDIEAAAIEFRARQKADADNRQAMEQQQHEAIINIARNLEQSNKPEKPSGRNPWTGGIT